MPSNFLHFCAHTLWALADLAQFPKTEEEGERKMAMLDIESDAYEKDYWPPKFPEEVWDKIRAAHEAHPKWDEYRLAFHLGRNGVHVNPPTIYRFLHPEFDFTSKRYR